MNEVIIRIPVKVCMASYSSKQTLSSELMVESLVVMHPCVNSYIETSVLPENKPFVKVMKTTSGTLVVYFP